MWNGKVLDMFPWRARQGPAEAAPSKPETVPGVKTEAVPAVKVQEKSHVFSRALGLLIVITIILGVLTPVGLGIWSLADGNIPKAVTTVYAFNSNKDQWEKSETAVELPDNPDGTKPPSSNTLVIRIRENEPVKQIVIFEATVVTGANEPLLEINGRDTGAISGTLRIGELTLKKVDAKRLEIKDTNVVRTGFTNVVAKDNEFDADLNVTNVVRVGRGAANTLLIGINKVELDNLKLIEEDDESKLIVLKRESGVRVDRIRILGPSTGFGSIESLSIIRTGVFGNILIRNVDVQDLILKDVSLDDS